MIYLKWILLFVCVALALRPLLAKHEDHDDTEGNHP
jgi:hypothetical protein